MKKLIFLLALLFSVAFASTATAQGCVMCKAAADSDKEANKGLNMGIVYLLSVPYILIGTVGYMWWRNRQALQQQDDEEEVRELLAKNSVPRSKTAEPH